MTKSDSFLGDDSTIGKKQNNVVDLTHRPSILQRTAFPMRIFPDMKLHSPFFFQNGWNKKKEKNNLVSD